MRTASRLHRSVIRRSFRKCSLQAAEKCHLVTFLDTMLIVDGQERKD